MAKKQFKEFKVSIRELIGVDTINFSETRVFSLEIMARNFFYSEIGAFLYNIDDIEDIRKIEDNNKKQLDVYCRGFVRSFVLYK